MRAPDRRVNACSEPACARAYVAGSRGRRRRRAARMVCSLFRGLVGAGLLTRQPYFCCWHTDSASRVTCRRASIVPPDCLHRTVTHVRRRCGARTRDGLVGHGASGAQEKSGSVRVSHVDQYAVGRCGVGAAVAARCPLRLAGDARDERGAEQGAGRRRQASARAERDPVKAGERGPRRSGLHRRSGACKSWRRRWRTRR